MTIPFRAHWQRVMARMLSPRAASVAVLVLSVSCHAAPISDQSATTLAPTSSSSEDEQFALAEKKRAEYHARWLKKFEIAQETVASTQKTYPPSTQNNPSTQLPPCVKQAQCPTAPTTCALLQAEFAPGGCAASCNAAITAQLFSMFASKLGPCPIPQITTPEETPEPTPESDGPCQCFSSIGSQGEAYCEQSGDFSDPSTCDAESICHWGPAEDPACVAMISPSPHPPPPSPFLPSPNTPSPSTPPGAGWYIGTEYAEAGSNRSACEPVARRAAAAARKTSARCRQLLTRRICARGAGRLRATRRARRTASRVTSR
jgi:hypothetical protein